MCCLSAAINFGLLDFVKTDDLIHSAAEHAGLGERGRGKDGY